MCPWRLRVSTMLCSRPSSSPNRACKTALATASGAAEVAGAPCRCGLPGPFSACHRHLRRHAVSGRDLDHRPRAKAEEPATPDFTRRQDHGIAAQVPAHSRQGLLHRLGPVGFRSHRPCFLSITAVRTAKLLTSDGLARSSDFQSGRRLSGSYEWPPSWCRWSPARAPLQPRCPGPRPVYRAGYRADSGRPAGASRRGSGP